MKLLTFIYRQTVIKIIIEIKSFRDFDSNNTLSSESYGKRFIHCYYLHFLPSYYYKHFSALKWSLSITSKGVVFRFGFLTAHLTASVYTKFLYWKWSLRPMRSGPSSSPSHKIYLVTDDESRTICYHLKRNSIIMFSMNSYNRLPETGKQQYMRTRPWNRQSVFKYFKGR